MAEKTKNILLSLKSSFIIIGLISVMLLASGRLWGGSISVISALESEKKNAVIIDAGHGGMDGGASGNGVIEKNLNLAIAMILRDQLTASGFEVIMVREDDFDLGDEKSSTIRQRKRSDLQARVNIANKYPNALYVSIHMNKFPSASVRGAQVFYTEKNGSKDLADKLQVLFKSLSSGTNNRQTKPVPDNVYIMNRIKNTALLIECGFVSNIEDVRELTSETYQKKFAFAIVCAVSEYYNQGS